MAEPVIRRVRPGDGARLRAVRIAAITDMPLAFAVSLEETIAHSSSHWSNRVVELSTGDRSAMFFALDGERTAGIMGTFFDERRDAYVLISVWVEPSHRGTSLASELHSAVIDWVRERGASQIFLEVWGGNTRAAKFYERLGYVFTGNSRPHDLAPAESELEMRLDLGSAH